jgi:hypothetical protein
MSHHMMQASQLLIALDNSPAGRVDLILCGENIAASLSFWSWHGFDSQRLVTSKARVHSESSLREIYVGQSGTEPGFAPIISVFPLSVSFQQCTALFHLPPTLYNFSS